MNDKNKLSVLSKVKTSFGTLYLEEDESYTPTRFFIRERTHSDYHGDIIDFAGSESKAIKLIAKYKEEEEGQS
tara:strand:- start:4303 stop:4521 length:219 start_codon:yes stop_codon:yes gene_type:complete